jgi:hypothetical protein
MNNTFPTLKEIQDVRMSRAPLTIDQMVKRIGDTVRLNYKNTELYSVTVKFPEFGSDSTNGHHFTDMFNQVISKIPGHYKCSWSWLYSELTFDIKW